MDQGKAPPKPPDVNGTPGNLSEYAPGSQLPTPKGYSTQGVKLTMAQQLKSYPSPRFQAVKPPYSFHRNFNWGDPGYMSGQGQPRVDPPINLTANEIEIQ